MILSRPLEEGCLAFNHERTTIIIIQRLCHVQTSPKSRANIVTCLTISQPCCLLSGLVWPWKLAHLLIGLDYVIRTSWPWHEKDRLCLELEKEEKQINRVRAELIERNWWPCRDRDAYIRGKRNRLHRFSHLLERRIERDNFPFQLLPILSHLRSFMSLVLLHFYLFSCCPKK